MGGVGPVIVEGDPAPDPGLGLRSRLPDVQIPDARSNRSALGGKVAALPTRFAWRWAQSCAFREITSRKLQARADLQRQAIGKSFVKPRYEFIEINPVLVDSPDDQSDLCSKGCLSISACLAVSRS